MQPISVLAAAALLVACGGGESPGADATATAALARKSSLGASEPARNKAPLAVTVDAKALYDWAEFKYAALFPKGPQNYALSYLGTNYTVRSYTNGNNLGLTDGGQIYGLGPFTGNALTSFGKLSDYAALVQADECKVYPANCTGPEPTGPVNECTMPASAALVIGNRFIVTYETTGGGVVATTNSDSLVDQNTTFEGQSVVRVSTTGNTSTTVQGVATSLSLKGKSYEQAASGGMTRTVGGEFETVSGGIVFMGQTIGGVTSNTRTVYNPGMLNSEFTLAVGQSLAKSTTSTTTTTTSINPTPQVHTSTNTATYTYERRESVTVRGKSYDTCRYKNVPATGTTSTQWVIVGKGVAARIESTVGADTTVTELVTGTLNGVPL